MGFYLSQFIGFHAHFKRNIENSSMGGPLRGCSEPDKIGEMTLGRKIEYLRKERGWTQAQLADLLAMTAHHVSRWENDRIRPRDKALAKLAELFEVTPEELIAAKKDTHADLASHDPELASMLSELPTLDDDQRHVLKHVLRSMITCRQMEQLVSQTRLKTSHR